MITDILGVNWVQAITTSLVLWLFLWRVPVKARRLFDIAFLVLVLVITTYHVFEDIHWRLVLGTLRRPFENMDRF